MNASDEIQVHHGGGDEPVHVGVLRPSFQGGRTLAGSSFEYSPGWLGARDAYPISPDLPMNSGRTYTSDSQVMFGAFGDAAPDQWGQRVIDANHAVRLRTDSSLPRRIGAFDYLTGVSDTSRMGALRLRYDDKWLSSDTGVANLYDLDRIVAAAGRYEADEATDEDVEYLGDVATSPGGARPKANVRLRSGELALAKLPHSKDGASDTEAWEAVALTIAKNAGVRTSSFDLHKVGHDKSVLVVRRFDRAGDTGRHGYISAATALGIDANDDPRVTYEDFADTIAELSAQPTEDLREMFARIALTVLVNNVDDHWQNHGFLRNGSGWRLSPAFDINPSPRRGTINSRAITYDDDPRDRDIANLLKTAAAYQLSTPEATDILHRVAEQVDVWPKVAEGLGIAGPEIGRMQGAFDMRQREYATSTGPPKGRSSLSPKEGSVKGTSPGGASWIKPHTRNGKVVGGYWRPSTATAHSRPESETIRTL